MLNEISAESSFCSADVITSDWHKPRTIHKVTNFAVWNLILPVSSILYCLSKVGFSCPYYCLSGILKVGSGDLLGAHSLMNKLENLFISFIDFLRVTAA